MRGAPLDRLSGQRMASAAPDGGRPGRFTPGEKRASRALYRPEGPRKAGWIQPHQTPTPLLGFPGPWAHRQTLELGFRSQQERPKSPFG